MKAEMIFYSATGTTEKIVRAVAEGMGCEPHFTDLKKAENRVNGYPADSDVTVIASPVYSARLPRCVYEYMSGIDGRQKPLVGICVYGNIGYGISLAQYEDYARKNRFALIAAGAFIGEHTYANKAIPVALNRPDAHDLEQARAFGKQIAEKLGRGDLKPPAIPKTTLLKFISRFSGSGIRLLIRQPAVDRSLCRECGICVKACPFGAIDPATLRIDERKCLRCYACAKVCPNSARRMEFRLKPFGGILRRLGGDHKENKTFI